MDILILYRIWFRNFAVQNADKAFVYMADWICPLIFYSTIIRFLVEYNKFESWAKRWNDRLYIRENTEPLTHNPVALHSQLTSVRIGFLFVIYACRLEQIKSSTVPNYYVEMLHFPQLVTGHKKSRWLEPQFGIFWARGNNTDLDNG